MRKTTTNTLLTDSDRTSAMLNKNHVSHLTKVTLARSTNANNYVNMEKSKSSQLIGTNMPSGIDGIPKVK